ncbi:hypothetical protein GOODEAATRI_013293, partial [Goodea atripinnis]
SQSLETNPGCGSSGPPDLPSQVEISSTCRSGPGSITPSSSSLASGQSHNISTWPSRRVNIIYGE